MQQNHVAAVLAAVQIVAFVDDRVELPFAEDTTTAIALHRDALRAKIQIIPFKPLPLVPVLREGNYEQLAPDENGIHRSASFSGLWLDAESMIGGEMARVLTVLQDGAASPQHSEFVQRLRLRGA